MSIPSVPKYVEAGPCDEYVFIGGPWDGKIVKIEGERRVFVVIEQNSENPFRKVFYEKRKLCYGRSGQRFYFYAYFLDGHDPEKKEIERVMKLYGMGMLIQ
jgi:hypothetical protein